MDLTALALVFTHILEGYDIPAPEGMLKVSKERAAVKHEDIPYSLLTNLAHAVLWQTFWLNKLAGGRKKSNMTEWKDDFRVPDPSEFPELKKQFIEGIKQAKAVAESSPFEHQCDSDDEAIDCLCRIAVHAAYHCGQLSLLKRIR